MFIMLGDMVLKDTEKPDSIEHGGGQMLAVNQFPGGNVSIQNFGSTYQDISWSGWFEGEDALERMYKIGNMRQKGEPILLITEKYTNKVVISEFKAEHRTNGFIPFNITLKRIIQITEEVSKETVDKISEELKEDNSSSQNKTYVVKSGDTLSKIAKNYYGNANDYDKIYQANKDILKSPHKISVGQELKIP